MNEQAAKILEEARKKKNLTQLQMAERLAEELKQTYSMRQYQRLEEGTFPKYKTEIVQAVDKILGTNIYDIIYATNVPREGSRDDLAEPYRTQLWFGKIIGNDVFAPFIPYKARAGYSKSYDQVDYLLNLETFQMPPGVNPRGTEWRWIEVGGDSMEPVLFEGDMLLCSMIAHADWMDIEQFKIFVIVWGNEVSVKRLAIKQGKGFVLISENDEHKQVLVPFEDVKEIWKVRRQLNAKLPPTKRFKITV